LEFISLNSFRLWKFCRNCRW